MQRILTRIALTALAIAGLTWAVAAPAQAFVSPPTLTISQGTASEVANATIVGECSPGTVDFNFTAVRSDDPSEVYDVSSDVSIDGLGKLTGYVVLGEVDPGTDLVFTLTCLAADSSVIDGVEKAYRTNDFGAEFTASTAALDSPISVTGTCGTAVGTQQVYYTFLVNGDNVGFGEVHTFDGSPWAYDLGTTPTEAGAVAGDTLTVVAVCFGDDLELPQTIRSADIEFPAVKPALAATGLDATPAAIAGVLLFGAGAAALLFRRRARA